jgi:hypothetical protein
MTCKIFDAKKRELGEIPVNKGLYCVKAPRKLFAGVASAKEPLTMEEVHVRLGHITPEAIRKMLHDGTITGITLDPAHSTMGACKSCKYAKATQKAIGKVQDPPRHEKICDEVHTDLWGPSPVQTIAKSQYFASFTDDHTCFTNLYLLKTKDETFSTYKSYEAWINMQFDTKIKCLLSDRRGEYLSEEFTHHLASHGTERKLTVHDTLEHDGMAEQLNRRLLERV